MMMMNPGFHRCLKLTFFFMEENLDILENSEMEIVGMGQNSKLGVYHIQIQIWGTCLHNNNNNKYK